MKNQSKLALLIVGLAGLFLAGYADAAVPGAIATMFTDMADDAATYVTDGVAILVVFVAGYMGMKVAKKMISKAS